MASDPYIREVGRIADEQGREVVVGVRYGTVTLRTLRTGTSGAVTLGTAEQEELGQVLIAAVWQAARDSEVLVVDAEIVDEPAAGGAP